VLNHVAIYRRKAGASDGVVCVDVGPKPVGLAKVGMPGSISGYKNWWTGVVWKLVCGYVHQQALDLQPCVTPDIVLLACHAADVGDLFKPVLSQEF